MEKRRVRWRLMERTKMERAKGKVVVTTNRRVWVNGKAWGWDNEKNEVIGGCGEDGGRER